GHAPFLCSSGALVTPPLAQSHSCLLKEYQQRSSPGVPAGAKTKKKNTGSSPETTTSGGCHSPGDSQNQEQAVALDSSSATINQLYENTESLVRVHWGPLIPRCQSWALVSPWGSKERGGGPLVPRANGELEHPVLTWGDPRTRSMQHGSSVAALFANSLFFRHPCSSPCHTCPGVVTSQGSTSLTGCQGPHISVLTQSLICSLSLDKPPLLLGLLFLEEVEHQRSLLVLRVRDLKAPRMETSGPRAPVCPFLSCISAVKNCTWLINVC
uniref:Uncharacterized protein n=1 Tax=Papio anubis TaxID=9555 RepID=A0A8I5R0E4_PAPAN